ncbi:MAG: ornithine cyclodeaminase family protein [Bacteroidota bacterium]
MQFISAQTIHEMLDFPSLVDVLKEGFRSETIVPQRMHIDYEGAGGQSENTLLLMPAIQLGAYAGVKIVNVAPENAKEDLATIQGVYYLMDSLSGVPQAIFDAQSVTNWRTAAASALAASYLAKLGASSLLMLGTGALAPFLIRAHAAIRPLRYLMIYGRTKRKAEAIAEQFREDFEEVTIVHDLGRAIPNADIISAATSSETPIIAGNLLRAGQHVDLVGAYKPTTREADDEVMRRGRIYVDNTSSVLIEAGDLVIPISSGVISAEAIKGDLFQLCRGQVKGRSGDDEITVFKSVGHAMEDLVTAMYLHGKIHGR